jgi:hypothetical protein
MGQWANLDATGSIAAEDFRRSALNLLRDCAGARPGETLLILAEDPGLGFYGPGLAEAVAREAKGLGLDVSLRMIGFSSDADTLPPELVPVVQAADHTLFLARLGDQLRFRAMPEGSRPIVSYALDRESFASPFGSAPYGAFVALKKAFDRHFAHARSIRVTCPLGTAFEGHVVPAPTPDGGAQEAAKETAREPADVTIKRFPMSVFAPVDATGFRGRVAVAHLLCGTGSRYYAPFGLKLGSTLHAVIEGGRLLRFEGEAGEVARAEAHYAHVAGLYGIDGGVVHSWHAGIHPGCAFAGSAHDSYERWSGSAFGNPRLLHFHTCGAYAPGEICWNIVDPTIVVDGEVIWDGGRIRLEAVPGAAAVLEGHPGLSDLFARPESRIGLGGEGASAP